MTLSIEIADAILSDVVMRHERQIGLLRSLAGNPDKEPDTYFRKILKIEADLQDIRQGLYAAAYVAVSCAISAAKQNDTGQKVSDAAISARARQYFREEG